MVIELILRAKHFRFETSVDILCMWTACWTQRSTSLSAKQKTVLIASVVCWDQKLDCPPNNTVSIDCLPTMCSKITIHVPQRTISRVFYPTQLFCKYRGYLACFACRKAYSFAHILLAGSGA